MGILFKAGDITGNIKNIVAGVNGQSKKIISVWTGKEGNPVKIWDDVKSPGSFYMKSAHGIYNSLDGVNWSFMDGSLYNTNSIAYGNGMIVCVGAETNKENCYSSDGIKWEKANGIPTGIEFYDVAFDEGIFVASYQKYYNKVGFYGSYDGMNWTTEFTISITHKIYGYIYGNQIYLKYDRGGKYIYYSTDCSNWIKGATLPVNISCITFGDGKFVIIGEDNISYITVDGVNWIKGSNVIGNLSVSHYMYDAVYGNGLFVCCGYGVSTVDGVSNFSNAFYSYDGINWSRSTGYQALGGLVNSLAFG